MTSYNETANKVDDRSTNNFYIMAEPATIAYMEQRAILYSSILKDQLLAVKINIEEYKMQKAINTFFQKIYLATMYLTDLPRGILGIQNIDVLYTYHMMECHAKQNIVYYDNFAYKGLPDTLVESSQDFRDAISLCNYELFDTLGILKTPVSKEAMTTFGVAGEVALYITTAEAFARAEILLQLPYIEPSLNEIFRHFMKMASVPYKQYIRRDANMLIKNVLTAQLNAHSYDAKIWINDTLNQLQIERDWPAGFRKKNDFEKFEKIRAKYSKKSIQSQIDEGIRVSKEKNYGKGLLLLSDALRRDSDNPQALRNIGLALFKAGYPEYAERYAEEACAIPSNWQKLAERDCIEIYMQNRKHIVAIKLTKKLLAEEKISVNEKYDLKLILQDAYYGSGQHEKAISEIDECLKSHSILMEDRYNLLKMKTFNELRAGRIEEAIKTALSIHNMSNLEPSKRSFVLLEFPTFLNEVNKNYVNLLRAGWAGNDEASASACQIFFSLFFLYYKIFHGNIDGSINKQVYEKILEDLYGDMTLLSSINAAFSDESINSKIRFKDINWLEETTLKLADMFSVVIKRYLDAKSINNESVLFTFHFALTLLFDDVKPWPSSKRCNCGANLSDYMFCDCGYNFTNLAESFYTQIPVSFAQCPSCDSEQFPGFRCDACGNIYSWFIE